MRRLVWLAAVGTLTLGLGMQLQAGGEKSDKDLLQGTWEVVKVTLKGMDLPLPKDKPRETIEFKGDKAIAKKPPDGKDDPADFKLDPTKKPKEIDLNPPKGAMKGIYELSGDTLKIGFADKMDAERPKGFTGDEVVVMTLKKKK